jgi:hypothetical protein
MQLKQRVDDLTAQLKTSNDLRKRTEQDFADYKMGHNSLKHELSEIAHQTREDTKVREIKRSMKAKFKQRMEAYEKQCYESMRVKIREAELTLKEQHRKEMQARDEW